MCFRISLLDVASKPFYGRRTYWQACNNDTQQRFQYRHNTDPCHTISETIEVYLNRQKKTDDGDNTDAVNIEVSFSDCAGIYRATYRKPRAKVIVSSP